MCSISFLEDLIKHEVYFRSMFQSLVWNIFKMVGNGFELELQLVWVWFGLKLILYMDLITHWFGIRIGHGHGMVWN